MIWYFSLSMTLFFSCVILVRNSSSLPPSPKNPTTWSDSVTLSPGSQVNIDHFTKEITMKNLVEPSPSSFDVAQKRIYALMEKDSLPRFVRSEFYQEFIKQRFSWAVRNILSVISSIITLPFPATHISSSSSLLKDSQMESPREWCLLFAHIVLDV